MIVRYDVLRATSGTVYVNEIASRGMVLHNAYSYIQSGVINISNNDLQHYPRIVSRVEPKCIVV